MDDLWMTVLSILAILGMGVLIGFVVGYDKALRDTGRGPYAG